MGNDSDSARVLNTFFSNIVSNLKIADYTKCEPLSQFISDPVLKSMVKYRNHPSILKIGEVCHGSNAINFSLFLPRSVPATLISIHMRSATHSQIL